MLGFVVVVVVVGGEYKRNRIEKIHPHTILLLGLFFDDVEAN